MDALTTLPGEDPATPYIEDAVHWITVYAQLLALDRYLLESVDAVEASPGLTRNDEEHGCSRELLRAMALRHAEREGFWRRRAEELRARGCYSQWPSAPSLPGR